MPRAPLIGDREEFAEGLEPSSALGGCEIASAPGNAHLERRAETGLRPGG